MGKAMWPEGERVKHLLERAKAGDAAALDDLLALCRDPLRRAVDLRLDRQITRREDASDIVQKVLFDAHRRIEDYLRDPKMPFHLWLRQMAQDRIIDAHRRHQAAGAAASTANKPPAPPSTRPRRSNWWLNSSIRK